MLYTTTPFRSKLCKGNNNNWTLHASTCIVIISKLKHANSEKTLIIIGIFHPKLSGVFQAVLQEAQLNIYDNTYQVRVDVS